MSDLLRRLVEESRREVAARRGRTSLRDLEGQLAAAPPPADFQAALRGEGLAVIAEMKAATPLRGRLATEYSPARLAAAYQEGGASALSVLCQATSFGGAPEHLLEARAAGLPVLRKDFVVDEYQLVEGRALHADAALLIAAALTARRLRELVACCRELGLQALVEVHSAAEVDAALSAGAEVVGVNHRDLTTFEVDLGRTEALRRLVPASCPLVAESGIRSRADAQRMRAAGADAILVGEALMLATDPAAKIRELAVA